MEMPECPAPSLLEAFYPFDASDLVRFAGMPLDYDLVVAFTNVPGSDDDSIGVFLTATHKATGVGVGTTTVSFSNGRCAWISDVYVHPQHRRRGVAGGLVRAACLLGHRHGLETAGLAVRDGSEAVRLYERLGFRYAWRSDEGMSAYVLRIENIPVTPDWNWSADPEKANA